MIVRIASEGQYELPDADADRLNELDNQAVAAVDAGDESRWRELWEQMLTLVQSDGRALADDELAGSDVILPPRDITFEEASREFTGEGLIPDTPAGGNPHAEAIAGILKRQEENGLGHLSEAEIGRELGVDAQHVTGHLNDMERRGVVARTAGGNWELTPAASSRAQAVADPNEPRQDGEGPGRRPLS